MSLQSLRTLVALLVSGLVAMTEQASAEQTSVEAAARAAGLRIETGTATVNGVAIYYRDMGPAGAPPIVLLHGFPETGDTFAPIVAELGQRYRMIVPDLRGAGASQRPASGYEKRIDADPLDRQPQHWGTAGFRIINR